MAKKGEKRKLVGLVSEESGERIYYGQELNPTTYNLARMNMILHGVHFSHFMIRQGNTLTEDMHVDLKAEAIVANPPFSAEWKGEKDPTLATDERFSQYGQSQDKIWVN
jgi:type I restriction enzyme M protein